MAPNILRHNSLCTDIASVVKNQLSDFSDWCKLDVFLHISNLGYLGLYVHGDTNLSTSPCAGKSNIWSKQLPQIATPVIQAKKFRAANFLGWLKIYQIMYIDEQCTFFVLMLLHCPSSVLITSSRIKISRCQIPLHWTQNLSKLILRRINSVYSTAKSKGKSIFHHTTALSTNNSYYSLLYQNIPLLAKTTLQKYKGSPPGVPTQKY